MATRSSPRIRLSTIFPDMRTGSRRLVWWGCIGLCSIQGRLGRRFIPSRRLGHGTRLKYTASWRGGIRRICRGVERRNRLSIICWISYCTLSCPRKLKINIWRSFISRDINTWLSICSNILKMAIKTLKMT